MRMTGLVILFFLCLAGSNVGTNIWLSEWSNDSTRNNSASLLDLRLGVYVGLGASQGKITHYIRVK